MLKIFKKLNKVEIISEPERRVDGFYFHVKVPCVVEPLTISTRDLLVKHVSQLSKEDKNIIEISSKKNLPEILSVASDEYINSQVIINAIRKFVNSVIKGEKKYKATYDLLKKNYPKFNFNA